MVGITVVDEFQSLQFPPWKVAGEKDDDVGSDRLVSKNEEVRGITNGTGDYDDREDNC